MTFSRLLLASSTLTLAAASPALAQQTDEASVNDIIRVTGQMTTFGATKSDTPILETARSVSIETEDMFLSKGALTLDDVLNYTSGVIGDQYGFSTRGDFYAVRGLSAPEYRDNLQSLFGNYNNTRPEIYTLEQVEVLKGPASVLYGQGSPGGLVNTVSKIAGAGMESEFVLSYGTHDRAQAATDLNVALGNDVFARLVALYRDSDTQVDYVTDDSVSLAPSLTWQPTEETSLTLLVNYDERDGDVAAQFLPLTGTLFDSASGQRIESSTYHGEPGFNHYDTESTAVTLLGSHVLNDIFTLEGTARWREGESDYAQSWITFAGAGAPRIDANGNGFRSWYDDAATSRQFAVDARVRAEFTTGGIEHEVLAGVNHQSIELTGSTAFLVQGTINAFDPVYGVGVPTAAELDAVRGSSESTDEYLGFYLNDQIDIGRFKFNAGVRFDDVENDNGAVTQSDDATTFAVGALYAFDNGLSPYVSFAQSFEPVIGTDAVTGDALKPREGEQIEVGLKYQPGLRTYMTLAWFDIEQSNLSNPFGLPNAPSQQEGVANIQGLEFEFLTGFDTGLGDLTLEANASTLDTEDPNGLPLASVPEEQASVWATLRPAVLENVRLGAGVRYVGESESNGVSVVDGSQVTITTDSYTLFDLLAAYDFEQWSVALNVRNVFDEDYYAACLARGDCFPGEDRTINLRLSRTF
ncbi:ferrisiderophore receptor [Marinicauda pacifica]|jgi:iron complex outermembrane recepter protein|uniref:TonB-dependent siderophore receptor n=1 Tax=Marinicauda pacifica TaxID=1133559 RepID=A0A4S2HEB7_9PROT|nr:TonB-dependent siderophore receptor [Marinicauda pacifica]TGY94213.1 TonB-dependent siderophore receptor [Marinicauda pacifica]GGE33906.1 ferrisiderophore receptor [Marinicauda pacifica]